MLIGYMRPYHDDWECLDQKAALEQLPCEQILREEHSSAKRRSELNQLLTQLAPGDKIVVYKLFAIADSTRHLAELLEAIHEKEAFLLSLSEQIDTSLPEGYPFHHIIKHLVEFQSDVISEKTKRGLYEAKQKGNTPGRPRKPDENVKRAILMYQSKRYTLAQIKEETGISKSTLYRYLESEGTY
ncbi:MULTISPECIES: recombinase family protein [Paenibacillus]|uniref:Helix-turn-helix domain-containing protein n=1 Tax=Paenibacillus campinasensis TaxID=66347 RepID=A0A268EUX2_9BACL|nr:MULTISPECIES: recombinase family protein [Paenibacillus]MUG68555.1 helix-turn-helix domain-containing protein [Paenibacillus campinasensis]PAD76922.1 resolvase [Paenibacillus campinasensis]PAK55957.1 resolvase [Paenibacillus sp. 7541]